MSGGRVSSNSASLVSTLVYSNRRLLAFHRSVVVCPAVEVLYFPYHFGLNLGKCEG